VVAALASDAGRGLSDAEVARRRQQHGPNELQEEPPVPKWRKFLAQFQNVLVILLLIATVISLAVWWLEGAHGVPFEATAILAIVLLNAVLGYIQEQRAEAAVAALRAMTTASATVLRDGRQQSIPSRDLVRGDIVVLEEGDAISADARVLESISLHVAEASLTGESHPVSKHPAAIEQEVGLGDRENMVFSGTAVAMGRGKAVVTATGMDSQIGRIAGMIQAAPEQATPLQKEMDAAGKLLGVAVIFIAVIVVAVVFWAAPEHSPRAIVQVLILGVSLAVAAVPEGLATILTVVLALGVQRMAKRHAIVKRLAAVETLGSASVICTDKTGTLTRNEMTVRAAVTPAGRVELSGIGYAPKGELQQDGRPLADESLRTEVKDLLLAGSLASNASLERKEDQWTIQGDPTEGALLVAARKAGVASAAPEARGFERLGEVPFTSERKMMSTIERDSHQPDRIGLVAKGAPDVLLNRCTQERSAGEVRPLTDARRSEILASVEELASAALRTLGVAYRRLDSFQGEATEQMERELVYLGMVGIIDPPRPEAGEAVAKAQSAGIRVIMITGDHPKTAVAIATELGIVPPGAPSVIGSQLEKMDDDQLEKTVREVSVYARVAPEHKLRIVHALKKDGHIVAMTGDGVNDAPALKTADIGVAMGVAGTEVARQAATMILTDDNFATIVAAVEEGRTIFANIRKFMRYLLSSNIGEVATMFFGVLLAGLIDLRAGEGELLVLPLLATQILWINLLTDSAPALAVGVDPPQAHVMRQPPRGPGERIITAGMWANILLVGTVMAVAALLALDAGLPGGLIPGGRDTAHARTMAFTSLVFCQLFNVFNTRSSTVSAFVQPFSNRWLWGAVALSVGLQIVVIYLPVLQRAFDTAPLSAGEWLITLGTASLVLWIEEARKWIRRHGAASA
jgi:potassium/sodium efflux P-type ATPase